MSKLKVVLIAGGAVAAAVYAVRVFRNPLRERLEQFQIHVGELREEYMQTRANQILKLHEEAESLRNHFSHEPPVKSAGE